MKWPALVVSVAACSLVAVGCTQSPGTGGANDLSVPLLTDLSARGDMTAPAACNPTDPMLDGTACTANGCASGTVAVGAGADCKCWQICDPAQPTECPCDRRCAPLTRGDMGVVGGGCLLANSSGERCGESGVTGDNALGCAQSLICVNADPAGAFRYCALDCTSGQMCPAQTSCLQLTGVTQKACVYNSVMGGVDGGSGCNSVDQCATGFLCAGGSCKPQCDRPGAACQSGTCSAFDDGTTTVGYVCE